MSDETRTVEQLMKSHFPGVVSPFRPCLYYQRELDSIRVYTRDCSVCEVRLNGHLTLYEHNYPEAGEDKYVGFAIESALRICQYYGLSQAPADLSEILDKLQVEFPDLFASIMIARRLMAELPTIRIPLI